VARVCRGACGALKILAISGSLRAAPANIEVSIYAGIDSLPYFNPDLDREFDDPLLPATVRELRAAIAGSDAVLISSPEYAHGVPGVLKNALDWLVGGPEMVGKRVALLNTSPHATHAQGSLAETLRTMSVVFVDAASIAMALPRGASDDALVGNEAVASELRSALSALVTGSA